MGRFKSLPRCSPIRLHSLLFYLDALEEATIDKLNRMDTKGGDARIMGQRLGLVQVSGKKDRRNVYSLTDEGKIVVERMKAGTDWREIAIKLMFSNYVPSEITLRIVGKFDKVRVEEELRPMCVEIERLYDNNDFGILLQILCDYDLVIRSSGIVFLTNRARELLNLPKMKKELYVSEGKTTEFIWTAPASDVIQSKIMDIISQTKEEFVVVSPWIDSEQVMFFHYSMMDSENETFGRFVLRGSGNKQEIKMFKELSKELGDRVRMKRNEILHAKIVLVDGSNAVISSANLIKTSLSRNYEAGVFSRDRSVISDVNFFIESLWDKSIGV